MKHIPARQRPDFAGADVAGSAWTRVNPGSYTAAPGAVSSRGHTASISPTVFPGLRSGLVAAARPRHAEPAGTWLERLLSGRPQSWWQCTSLWKHSLNWQFQREVSE